MATPTQWMYLKEGEQRGPISSEELRQLALTGHLLPSDQVWKEGMAEWQSANEIRGLQFMPLPDAPAAAVATMPPPPKSGTSDRASQLAAEGVRLASMAVATGTNKFKQHFSQAIASTAANATSAFASLLKHPILLSVFTLVFMIAASMAFFGVITSFLFPMFAMGYLSVVRQILAGESMQVSGFISFMRHGWNSVWHLFMLLASFIITVSIMLAPVIIAGFFLYFVLGTGGLALSLVWTESDATSMTSDSPFSGGEYRHSHPQHPASNEFVATLVGLISGLVGIVFAVAIAAPLCSATILFFYLVQNVSTRPANPSATFDLVYDAFGDMIQVARRCWKELMFSGLFIAVLWLGTTLLSTLALQIFSLKVLAWFTLCVQPVLMFALMVYVIVFMATTCLKLGQAVTPT